MEKKYAVIGAAFCFIYFVFNYTNPIVGVNNEFYIIYYYVEQARTQMKESRSILTNIFSYQWNRR